MMLVADTADIVCGATKFMWGNFASHGKFQITNHKLLVMWGNLALLHMTNSTPHDNFTMYAVLAKNLTQKCYLWSKNDEYHV